MKLGGRQLCNSTLSSKGPGTQAPFSSSLNVFRLHMTMSHLTGSSYNRAAAVSRLSLSQVLRELRLQRSHGGSRQLVDKAPHSIMDDQNSWLCMYDNWSLFLSTSPEMAWLLRLTKTKIIAGLWQETRNWKRTLAFGIKSDRPKWWVGSLNVVVFFQVSVEHTETLKQHSYNIRLLCSAVEMDGVEIVRREWRENKNRHVHSWEKHVIVIHK